MSHTGRSGQFCLTASALVFSADATRVLVHRHKRYPVVIPPGGHVDPGEHPWTAVLRELEEEVGIVPDQLQVLTPLAFTPGPGRLPTPVDLDVHEVSAEATHTDVMFAFVIDGAPRGLPALGESQELAWLTVAELATHPDVPARIAAVAGALQPSLALWPRLPATAVGGDVRPALG
ncbi:MAG: NUDIX domain-containing protein [Propionibacteriales bacterium]|nr:NUDIX domain-containing protein [Propionibacteriales bacterium]